jgi:hypothetical protein
MKTFAARNTKDIKCYVFFLCVPLCNFVAKN